MLVYKYIVVLYYCSKTATFWQVRYDRSCSKDTSNSPPISAAAY